MITRYTPIRTRAKQGKGVIMSKNDNGGWVKYTECLEEILKAFDEKNFKNSTHKHFPVQHRVNRIRSENFAAVDTKIAELLKSKYNTPIDGEDCITFHHIHLVINTIREEISKEN